MTQTTHPATPEPAEPRDERTCYDRDLAGALVASAISEKHHVFVELASWFQPEYFQDPFWGDVFSVLLEAHAEEVPVTSKTLATLLLRAKKKNHGARFHDLVTLIDDYSGLWHHYRFYARQVYDRWRRYQLAEDTDAASHDVLDANQDVDEVIERMAQLGNRYIAPPHLRADRKREILLKLLDEAEGRRPKERTGTGLHSLDKILSLEPCTVTVVGGRPGAGKSALLGHIAISHAIEEEGPFTALVFSLEMGADQWLARMSAWLQAPPTRMTTVEAMATLDLARIRIVDDMKTLKAIVGETATACRHSAPHEVMVFVDYLQLVDSAMRTDSREQKVAEISRTFKRLAMSCGIRIIVACQLSRASTESSVPRLHHLRESGAIEQDADNVILIHHDESTAKKEPLVEAKLALAKYRNGPIGLTTVMWNRPGFRFLDKDYHHHFPEGD